MHINVNLFKLLQMEQYYNISSNAAKDEHYLIVKDFKNLNDEQIKFFKTKINYIDSIITDPKLGKIQIFKLLLTFDQMKLLEIIIPNDVNIQFSFYNLHIYLQFDNWNIKHPTYKDSKFYFPNSFIISIYQCEKYDNNDILIKTICEYLDNYKINSVSFKDLDYFDCSYLQYISQINTPSLDISKFININYKDNLCFPYVKHLIFNNYFPNSIMFPNLTSICWIIYQNFKGIQRMVETSNRLNIFTYYETDTLYDKPQIYSNHDGKKINFYQLEKMDENIYIPIEYFPIDLKSFSNLNYIHFIHDHSMPNHNAYNKLKNINNLYKLKITNASTVDIVSWLITYFKDNDNIQKIIIIDNYKRLAHYSEEDITKLLGLLIKKSYFKKLKINMIAFELEKYFKIINNDKIFNLFYYTNDDETYNNIQKMILNNGYSYVKQLFSIPIFPCYFASKTKQISINAQKINKSLKSIC